MYTPIHTHTTTTTNNNNNITNNNNNNATEVSASGASRRCCPHVQAAPNSGLCLRTARYLGLQSLVLSSISLADYDHEY